MSETPASLTATYTSPTSSQTFAFALPALPVSDSVEEKTSFVSAVRVNASKMQDQINAFLTQKMEEDNKAAQEAGDKIKKSKDEEREEEMYGEEDVGED